MPLYSFSLQMSSRRAYLADRINTFVSSFSLRSSRRFSIPSIPGRFRSGAIRSHNFFSSSTINNLNLFFSIFLIGNLHPLLYNAIMERSISRLWAISSKGAVTVRSNKWYLNEIRKSSADFFTCSRSGIFPYWNPLSLANSGIRAALGHLFTFKFAILVLVILLSILFYRPFCKWICPLGAVYSLFNSVSLLKLRVDSEKCVGCQKCSHACKMDVRVTDTPNHPECIRCGACMKACPTNAICYHYGFSGKKQADHK